MGYKKVTLRDLAEKTNLSTATVSMILNKKNLSRFSQKTVDTVNTIARKSGYISTEKEPKKIMIICPSLINPYFATLIQGMEMEAIRQNYTTEVYTTYWNKKREQECCKRALDPTVGAVIFAMIPQQPDKAKQLNQMLPVVAVGDPHQVAGLDTIHVDNFAAGTLIADHLKERGHSRVAYLSTTMNREHSSRVQRYLGLKDRFGDLEVITESITPEEELNTVNIEYLTGYKLAERCLDEHPAVTAMVAINDMIAYGVLAALHDHHKKVPEDICVAGFDNLPYSALPGISLTSVDHNIISVGRSAVRMIGRRIHHNEDDALFNVEYRCKVIERNSTATCT